VRVLSSTESTLIVEPSAAVDRNFPIHELSNCEVGC
jgi:hypothetical protein